MMLQDHHRNRDSPQPAVEQGARKKAREATERATEAEGYKETCCFLFGELSEVKVHESLSMQHIAYIDIMLIQLASYLPIVL